MWLDELTDLVRKLRERIEKQGALLRQNETRTRYALVDPVLEALGWHLRDPHHVVPEYDIEGGGRSDYALLGASGDPCVLVEAKRLGTALDEGLDQSIRYALRCGAQYVVVTDGARWEVYDRRREGKLAEMKVLELSVQGPPGAFAVRAVWLWRGNFVTGKPVVPVAPPVREPGPEPNGGGVSTVSDGWLPLTDLHPQPKEKPRPPQAIRFPDSKQRPLTYWWHVQARVVEWLVESKKLSAADCPVRSDKGAHMVHTKPVKQNGTKFENPHEVSGLCIEGFHTCDYHAYYARSILKARRVDPATVHVLSAD